jgi:hypothetical protein
VDLNATVAVRTAFFDRRGDGQAVSFQRAEAVLMNDKKFSHPYYWAAFFLIASADARYLSGPVSSRERYLRCNLTSVYEFV